MRYNFSPQSLVQTVTTLPLLERLRTMQRSPTEWAFFALWIFYLCSYPIAVTGVAFDVHPGFSMAWAGSILLFIQGIIGILWLVLQVGWRRGLLLASIGGIGGILGETLGVATGFPFGHYYYTHILFPRLPGSVPLPLAGAWLLVITSSVAIARWLVPGNGGEGIGVTRIKQIAIAAVAGMGMDLVLEPVAVKVQYYWIWQQSGPYFGIPTSNFIGWGLLCAVLTGVILYFWPQPQQTVYPMLTDWPSVASSGIWMYVLTAFMFGVIDLTHGLLAAALVSITLLLTLLLRWHKPYHTMYGRE